jgi:peptide-methionine (S)-S-oxide reductase
VQIDYDPDLISFQELLEVFFSAHDPGARSFSRQYRSAIFFHDQQQERLAREMKNRLQKDRTIYTDISPLGAFFMAENYHQKYYLRSTNVLMSELRAQYPQEAEFIDSTAAARLNGYVAGYGTREQLEQEIGNFRLSERAQLYLRDRVSRRLR